VEVIRRSLKDDLLDHAETMQAIRDGWNAARIRRELGWAGDERNFRKIVSELKQEIDLEEIAPKSQLETRERPEKRPDFRQTLLAAQLNPPVDAPPPNPEIEELRRELGLLREQLRFAQHADPQNRAGGKATIVVSDLHFGDRSHMGRSWRAMRDKTSVVLKQYEPEVITVLHNGDAVAGRGIYKEQNMEAVLQFADDQVKAAAWHIYEWDRLLKESFPAAVVSHRFTRGNHDMAMKEPLCPHLVLLLRSVGVAATYCGDCAILNLASSGCYHLYAEHGYGYSGISPSSPKWLSDMKDKLLSLVRRGYHSEKSIRRVTHGHTHWMQLNMERIAGYFYDCTGGCQRNERVLLGKNLRPMGMIAYISPEGYEGILEPIGIQPDLATVDAELADPYLFNRNMEDCSHALQAFDELLTDKGLVEMIEPEGR
jgi:hypothetical protein